MNIVLPGWDVSPRVRAFATTRSQGNLAMHVGEPEDARRNRIALVEDQGLPSEPMWLEQVHGNVVATATDGEAIPRADAAYTRAADAPLVVMVADCLPILVATRSGIEIGVAHAGWRGLACGVIGALLRRFEDPDVVAWLGPAIGACHYEVDEVVRREFVGDVGFAEGRDASHWMMDLAAIARHQLQELGVASVYDGEICTWCDGRFYSHRRDGRSSPGRIAALIWRSSD